MTDEEIIILEDDEAPLEQPQQSSQPKKEESKPKKDDSIVLPTQKSKPSKPVNQRLIFIVALGAFLFILLIIIIFVFFKKPTVQTQIDPVSIARELQEKAPQETFEPSKLDSLLQKANLLYNQGNKQDALKIYEDIALFNEGVSFYNIGVAKMNELEYEEALEAFKQAIKNRENRTISAINAAVCGMELNNADITNYYLDLAHIYLPEESNSPLFSYYTGLIYYYKGMYLEALSAFSRPSSEHYKQRQTYLASKILTYLNLDFHALDMILKDQNSTDNLTIGLLYGRIEEFDLAKKHLLDALRLNINNKKTLMALALVELKLGNMQSASNYITQAQTAYKAEIEDVFPIKTSLQKSLFDVALAQKDFQHDSFFDKEKRYATLFYYAPYKIFDAQQNIDHIRKGGMSINQGHYTDALDYLQNSASISQVNAGIARGISSALEYRVFNANQIFETMIVMYPQHAMLHYNLALTYAQLGNYSLANKHFTTSYRLDPKNYLSGVFALMSADLIGKDIALLLKDVKEALTNEKRDTDDSIHTALVYLVENNILPLARWLEEPKEKNGLNLALDVITARITNNVILHRQKAFELRMILPTDLMSNIIYFNSSYGDGDIKDYARSIQMEFRALKVDMNAFYFGPLIAKEQYIKLLQLGGILNQERNVLLERLESTTDGNHIGITNSLAFISIYTNHFKEAYVLYNQLIDEYKIQDSATLFLGSVAAIGANQNANAIALLELSKLKDPTNNESRYALGLLYQEAKNFEGAKIQYNLIGDNGFSSKYFAFSILGD